MALSDEELEHLQQHRDRYGADVERSTAYWQSLSDPPAGLVQGVVAQLCEWLADGPGEDAIHVRARALVGELDSSDCEAVVDAARIGRVLGLLEDCEHNYALRVTKRNANRRPYVWRVDSTGRDS